MKNQITNLITKIISILVIMLMIVNSSLMLVISVAADAVQKIIDEAKTNAIYELNIEKYVNYKIGDKQGTLVQTNLKTGIEYQEGQEYAPIQETSVTINTPKINDKYPENVEIITKSTKATNGDGNGKDVNYTYNKENGQLQIITENKADDKGNIYSENVAGARDEYQIDFYYDADCYNGENQKRVLSFTGKENLKVKNNENEAQISKDIKSDFEVAENISGLISTNVTTSDIYNGFINANVKNGTANDTEYIEYMNIQVGYKEIADEMHVTLTNTLKNKNDKETETTDVVYKGLKLNKQNILDVLGEDGNLQVLDNKGNKLAEVNKDTNANDDGIMQKGVMIRHLVLPNNIENSKKVLNWISSELPKEIYVSVMAQYFPTYKAKEDKYNINRKLTACEWKLIQDEIDKLGIENGFIQELGEHEEEYVPKWEV